MRHVFTRNTLPHEGGGHRQGDVVDLVGASLQRWLRRGAVQPVVDPPPRQAEVTPQPPPVEPEPAAVPDPPPVKKPVAKRRTTKRITKPTEE